MAKAILIMDMPSRCSTCQLCVPSEEYTTWCTCKIYPTMMIPKRKMNTRQEYCPLREFPQKKGDNKYYALGYNACIDEILGGGE